MMRFKYVKWICFALLFWQCTKDEIVIEDMDWKEIFDESDHRSSDAIKNDQPLNISDVVLCQKILSQTYSALPTLKSAFKDTSAPVLDIFNQLLNAKALDCEDPKKHTQAMRIVEEFLTLYSKKIGVLLPLSGNKQALGESLLKGMKAAFKDEKNTFDEFFIVKDHGGETEKLFSSFAQLVLQNNVKMIIASPGSSQDIALLATYAKKLMLPIMMIYKDSMDYAKNSFVFHNFPSDENQASGLAKALALKGYKNVSILKPASGKADKLCTAFSQSLEHLGITVAQTISYTSGNYSSMNKAASLIAGTDPSQRQQDYQTLYDEMKRKAEDNNSPFNPRFVVLKPKLKSSVVFIPDNFRIVRHFVNLFKYQGVKSLTLVGNNEWRSKSIVEPWEPFLYGGIFSDHIGTYNTLPSGIEYSSDGSHNFVPVQQTLDVDLQWIGYRSAWIAQTNNVSKRQHWIKTLKSFTQEPYLAGKTSFVKHQLNWPTFVFRIKGRELESLPSE